MHSILASLKDAALQLLFPRICPGCGGELPGRESFVCTGCLVELPETGFAAVPGNPVERKFWGRLSLAAASATYHFRTGGVMQQLMHQFKYGSDQQLGIELGRSMGRNLLGHDRFHCDLLVPLPLHPLRERKRGYNQATLLCRGMAVELGIPVIEDAVRRVSHTSSQTTRSRTERWLNMEGRFQVTAPLKLSSKKLLLVDDVVTTGATLEACGVELLKIPGVSLGVATLCYASQV